MERRRLHFGNLTADVLMSIQPLNLSRSHDGAFFLPDPSPAPERVKLAFSSRWSRNGAGRTPFDLGAGTASPYLENRRAACAKLGLDPDRLTVCRQTHSTRVALVTGAMAGMGLGGPETAIQNCDGMATVETDTPLMVATADCAPVLLFDADGRAVSAVHAGWRGALGGILGAAVEALTAVPGISPSNLRAAIGPCIGPCCCEVGPEFRTARHPVRPRLIEREGKLFLNLWTTVEETLIEAGLDERGIFSARVCTACNRKDFFSYRAEAPNPGSMGSFIGIKTRPD